MSHQPASKHMKDLAKIVEDKFFMEHDAELLAQLRAKKLHDSAVHELEEKLHFPTTILDKFVDMGLDAHNILAIQMVPLVVTAWASGTVDAAEKAAILSACKKNGYTENASVMHILENWLTHKPAPTLLATWKEFVLHAKTEFSAEDFQHLKSFTHDWTQTVGEASHHFLGFHWLGDAEKAILQEVDACFA